MNINFQSVNYNADNKLIEFAEKRIKKEVGEILCMKKIIV